MSWICQYADIVYTILLSRNLNMFYLEVSPKINTNIPYEYIPTFANDQLWK